MLSIIKSISLQGLSGYIMNVEVDIASGIPNWEIVRIAKYKCQRIKRKSKVSNKKF